MSTRQRELLLLRVGAVVSREQHRDVLLGVLARPNVSVGKVLQRREAQHGRKRHVNCLLVLHSRRASLALGADEDRTAVTGVRNDQLALRVQRRHGAGASASHVSEPELERGIHPLLQIVVHLLVRLRQHRDGVLVFGSRHDVVWKFAAHKLCSLPPAMPIQDSKIVCARASVHEEAVLDGRIGMVLGDAATQPRTRRTAPTSLCLHHQCWCCKTHAQSGR
mmetsp:Transcript_14414/g.46020  ORF Transcript_14414/g.46020 Transcript_14414/m.46020 type:complete len:221 (+) Transcript_14414:1159-1821(+)